MPFHHAHEARVRERHGDIRIASDESPECFDVRFDVVRDLEHPSSDELENDRRASGQVPEEKTSLGQNRFTYQERRLYVRPLLRRPSMIAVTAVEEWHQRTCV